MSNERARALRRTMTDAERRLWYLLRDRRLEGYKIRRQYPCGPFILDFACIKHRLAVEADGGQHADNTSDERRTRWLQLRGWRVLRFWNNDIFLHGKGVRDEILRELVEGSHPPGAVG